MFSTNEFPEPSLLEDYRSGIKGSGFSPDEFELKQQRTQPTGMLYDPLAGNVTVVCKVTGVEKIYELSSGTSWPVEFLHDLHGGFFGRKA